MGAVQEAKLHVCKLCLYPDEVSDSGIPDKHKVVLKLKKHTTRTKHNTFECLEKSKNSQVTYFP